MSSFLTPREHARIKGNLYQAGVIISAIILAWYVYRDFMERSYIVVNYDERFSSSVFDMCLLSKKYLVANDSANKSVKLIDLEQQAVVSILNVETEPYCITKVNDTQVAITLPDASKIQLVSISRISETKQVSLLIERNISVRGRPIGVKYWNEKFIVVIAYPAAGVYIINMDGIVIKNFTHFETGDKLFQFPYLLSAHIENNIMYITDIATNLVTSLTLDGKIRKFYNAHDILLLLGLSVDKMGRLYLCRTQFHEIFRLNPDLTQGEVILNKSHGLFSPVSAAYDDETQKLYVGSNFGHKIKMFTIKN